ncbi:hypothetical protein PIB30_060816 [Stylosanthes scabra]|uniref:Uncharacterized protein n=1 Tax=Stylosanthes scabra TaxID=79078 RepID=A0ABU6QKB4_9FABA|nr:hypothetical protein [Stylosanthes scabra]
MDKKEKKTVRYLRSKIYAKTVAAKTPIAPTPPLTSMLGVGKAGDPDSYLGTPFTTSGSSDDDDFLRDESMQWEYGDIDIWKVMATDESSEGSCPGGPPNP